MQKLQNSRTTLPGEKVTEEIEEERERKKNAVNRDQYVLTAKFKGSACTSLGPKSLFVLN